MDSDELVLSEIVIEKKGIYYEGDCEIHAKERFTGECKFYHDNGQIKGLVNINNGLPDGNWQYWDSNGIKILDIYYDNRKMIKKEKKNKQQLDLEFINLYLDKYVFKGLTNLYEGFDSESIKYFNSHDFKIVLDRVEELGLGIYGIEPWKNGVFYDVLTYEEYNTIPTDPKWYRAAFNEFLKSGVELQYAASYQISDKLKNIK